VLKDFGEVCSLTSQHDRVDQSMVPTRTERDWN
jgi:hypothetical protein